MVILRVFCGVVLLFEVSSDRILEMSSGVEFIVGLKVEFTDIFGDLCIG